MRKRLFSLLEVMIAITLMVLAASSFGWKLQGLVEKKRFTASVDRLESRLQTCRQLALNQQSDWEIILERKEKVWTFDARSIDNLPPSPFRSSNLDFTEISWNGQKKDRYVLTLTSTGSVFPQGRLTVLGKKGEKEWIFPDFFVRSH